MSRFCVENFVSQCRKISQRNLSDLCFWKFLVSKKDKDKRGGGNITIFCQNFLSDSAEKLRRGTHQCVINFGFRKILGFRELCHDFVSKTLSHSAEKPRRGTHQCVINFGFRKILGFRELCHDFVSKILSHSAEKFRRETFLICASENFWSRKTIRIRGGGEISRFSVKTFCLTVPKNFVGEPISVSLNSGFERF